MGIFSQKHGGGWAERFHYGSIKLSTESYPQAERNKIISGCYCVGFFFGNNSREIAMATMLKKPPTTNKESVGTPKPTKKESKKTKPATMPSNKESSFRFVIAD
ncbi:hypothetical protein CWM47_17945 [Spirosoma pollinicola]|uniref:Uncharacterized protein n=1 Tax=Spirosoma pollinicola TaxID=2057025 RepID=A0A2K8Z115_9BACT|nr:hypothetical protein CWM47_17945 [Spirosoma pollinicola]